MRNKLLLVLIINVALSIVLVTFKLYTSNFNNKIEKEIASLNRLVNKITEFNKLFSEENVDL